MFHEDRTEFINIKIQEEIEKIRAEKEKDNKGTVKRPPPGKSKTRR